MQAVHQETELHLLYYYNEQRDLKQIQSKNNFQRYNLHDFLLSASLAFQI